MIENLISYFEDEFLDEVLINGTRSMVLQGRKTRLLPSPYLSAEQLVDDMQTFVWRQGVRLDARLPYAGGVYEDVWRWHAMVAPLAGDGPLFSLRRHRFEQVSLESFSSFPTHLESIQKLVHCEANILICGPTASGKTTFLSALLWSFFSQERIIFLEQVPEMKMSSPNWIRLQAKAPDVELLGEVDLERALQESLRLRPDRIVIGEIRGDEMRAFLLAATSGHGSVFSTMHASNLSQVHQKLGYLMKSRVMTPCEVPLGIVLMQRGHPPEIIEVISYS